MNISHKNLKSLITFLVPLAFITLFSFFIQITIVSHPERVGLVFSSLGPFFILGYILFQLAAIIIPPVPGSIVAIPLLAILGPLKGFALIYLVTTPAECINFLIAKRYGRPVVQKLLGKKSIEKVDDYTKDAGVGTLVVLKLFTDSYFDYISYGLGLTSVKFRQFVFVNFGIGLLNAFIKYIVFIKAPNFTSSIVFLEIVAGILTASYILYKHWQHGRRI